MSSDGLARNFGYDADNRLKTVARTVASVTTASTLSYDPAGRLYQVAVAGSATTKFLYSGAEAIAEYDASDALQRRYVKGAGADETLVWYEGSGTTDRRWLMTDPRGSVIAVANSAGAVTSKNKYDDYGAPAAGNVGRFQYTGQMWLAEAGLYHNKARAYHPELGRFLQADPIGYGDGLNMYAYVGNDPINGTDPSGLAKKQPDDQVRVVCNAECQARANGSSSSFGGTAAGFFASTSSATNAAAGGGAGWRGFAPRHARPKPDDEIVVTGIRSNHSDASTFLLQLSITDYILVVGYKSSAEDAACYAAVAAAGGVCVAAVSSAALCPETGVSCIVAPELAQSCTAAATVATGICMMSSKKLSPRCQRVKSQCIDKCTDEELPTSDYGTSFYRCVNRCMAENGCPSVSG